MTRSHSSQTGEGAKLCTCWCTDRISWVGMIFGTDRSMFLFRMITLMAPCSAIKLSFWVKEPLQKEENAQSKHLAVQFSFTNICKRTVISKSSLNWSGAERRMGMAPLQHKSLWKIEKGRNFAIDF